MAQEQAFEEQGEENVSSLHRQWQGGEEAAPDLGTMVEQHGVMTSVNQRLAEHRTQPVRRSVGDTMAWSVTAVLGLSMLDFMSGFNFFVPPVLLALWLYSRNLHKLDIAEAALDLQEFDRYWIGPLFEALSWPNRRIRRIVRLKLIHLLPLLKEEDGRSLSQKQRRAIYGVLEQSHDTDLKIAILKSIVRFGDASAVSVVEKLAGARAWTSAGYRVRREALICLPRLREQALKQQERLAETFAPLETAPLGLEAETPLSMEAQSPVTASVQDDSARANLEAEREKVARPAMRMAFLMANYSVIVPFSLYQTVSSFASHAPLFGLVWTGITIGTTQLHRVSLSTKRVTMMRKQAQLRDIRGVGLLAEALTWPEQDLQYEAASALTVLLPLLKANHASLLSAEQRNCLHRELTLQNARSQSDLIVAILQAFQQVGDSAAIPYVERLADTKPRTPQEQKVVQEAKECLPYLRLCALNNTASHSLLRASSLTDTAAADQLLRASWDNLETKPEQLLRPSDIEGK